MNLVITTGCPDSGWEMATQILQQSGLELAPASVNLWLDECFQAPGTGDLMQISQPLQPASGLVGRLAALFPKHASSPVLLADSRHTWLLDFWAGQFPGTKFLLFFTRADTALALALQQEAEPWRFLEQWQAVNRQLLNFHRRHRQCTLLLDAEAACLYPQALEAACRRIGLALKPTAKFAAPATPLSAMERLLAEHLLAAQPAVQMLQMELEASSQPLGDIPPKVQMQPVEVVDSFRQSQAYQRKLMLQLHQAQEELDAATQMNRQNEQTLKQKSGVQQELKAQLEQAHQALKKLESGHRETTQDNELLLLQLHQVQEELDAITQMNRQNEQTLKQKSGVHQELKAQLEQAHQALKKLESGHRETTRENELLLLQLQEVQKEQGHYYLKWQELSEERQRRQQSENGEIDRLREPGKATTTLPLFNASQAIFSLFSIKRKERKEFQKQVDLLKESGFFDEAWYFSAYPDVASSGLDPVKHYLIYGAAEGRNPSPAFDTRAYLAANPDVVDAGINSLVHFVKFGRNEGRLLHKPKGRA